MTRGFLGLDRRGWPGTIVVAALDRPDRRRLADAQRARSRRSARSHRARSSTSGGRRRSPAADGWSEDVEQTSRLEGRAVLSRGALSYLTEARASARSLEDEYARFADDIRHSAGAQLFNGATTFTTESGLTGISGSYASPNAGGSLRGAPLRRHRRASAGQGTTGRHGHLPRRRRADGPDPADRDDVSAPIPRDWGDPTSVMQPRQPAFWLLVGLDRDRGAADRLDGRRGLPPVPDGLAASRSPC